jgi:hypothetical protein
MQDPVEFELQGHRFRYTPLPAMPLAREHHKLLVRFDGDSGALNTLAFNFDKADFGEIMRGEAAGVFRLVKLVSMLVGADTRRGATPVDDEGAPIPAPVDELPNSLDGLFLYYARLGKVQQGLESQGSVVWADLQSEEAFNAHPCAIAPAICAAQVLRGIFDPFVGPLLGLIAKAKARASTKSTSTNEETNEPAPPTSES